MFYCRQSVRRLRETKFGSGNADRFQNQAPCELWRLQPFWYFLLSAAPDFAAGSFRGPFTTSELGGCWGGYRTGYEQFKVWQTRTAAKTGGREDLVGL
jgi:hypothetical protein